MAFYMEYLWAEGIEKPQFPSLEGDAKTEVLIIGGGMTGVLCALELQNRGVDYLLAEGAAISGGITRGTTAVITAQHDVFYFDLIAKFGKEKAKLYLDANLRAVQKFEFLSHSIECEFEERPSLMFSIADRRLLEREADAVKSLGFDAQLTDKAPLPYKVAGAVVYPGMAQFHPLKFLYSAARGLNIHESTFIKRLDGTTAYTDDGKKIEAKKVIVAAHFPFIDSHGMYFVKLYQKRSYIIAYENAPDLGCTIIDAAENGIYMRNYRDLLIIGGGDRRTGKKDSFSVVRDYARRYFPDAKEKYAWANQDCMSLDDVPYIGEYSPSMPDVCVATGYNEWGMTTSAIAAEILSDMVTGRENRFAPAFSPRRSVWRTQLFANLGATLANFVKPVAPRCSHLGCALVWNTAEHTWDCPCHGSRYNQRGKCICNPATKDIKM